MEDEKYTTANLQSDELNKPILTPQQKQFWKMLTFRDYVILALIIGNVFFFYKFKDYDLIKQQSANGNWAATVIYNLQQQQSANQQQNQTVQPVK